MFQFPVSPRKGVLDTPPYRAGTPISIVAREQGLDPACIVKLASNENPLGPSPMALEAIRREASELHRYPDGSAWELTQILAQRLGLNPGQLVMGNGSNEILELVAQAFLEPGTNAVMGQWPFVVYPLVTLHFGAEVRKVPMPGLRHDLNAMLEAIDANTRLVFVASPNNPTPFDIEASQVQAFIDRMPPHVILVFDEAYAEYLDQPVNLVSRIQEGKNILCTRTFSKIYGLAGLRIGYGYGPEWLIALLQRTRQPFSVNSLALAGAQAALQDDAFVTRSRTSNQQGILQLREGFSRMGLSCHAGQANFLLLEVRDPDQLCKRLLQQGLIVRPMASFSLDGMIRISIGSAHENERLLQTLSSLL
jgi:histidinol-phosphate aminotransferase